MIKLSLSIGAFMGLLQLAACSQAMTTSETRASGASQDDSLHQKNPDSPHRPTDESEGVPGYLTAPQQGLATLPREASQRLVAVYRARVQDLRAPLEVEESYQDFAAQFVARSTLEKLGSLRVGQELSGSEVLIAAPLPQPRQDRIRVVLIEGEALPAYQLVRRGSGLLPFSAETLDSLP